MRLDAMPSNIRMKAMPLQIDDGYIAMAPRMLRSWPLLNLHVIAREAHYETNPVPVPAGPTSAGVNPDFKDKT